MTVSEAISEAGITPSSSFIGIETADDMIFAVKTADTQTSPANYTVCADHITSHTGSINNKTSEATYIRTGPETTKTSSSETISFEGVRRVGDVFQDFVLSHGQLFATGQDAKVEYVYFSIRTGVGTKGTGTLLVNTHSGGSAGENMTFSGSVASDGKPDEYTYTAA